MMVLKGDIFRISGIFLLAIGFWGCQETPYDPSMYYITDADLETGERSLIDHPYIFEDLGLKLDEFKYVRDADTISIKAVLQGNLAPYQDCLFYIHAYPDAQGPDFDKLTGPLKLESNRLIHQGSFDVDSTMVYQEVRFGLGCNKERPITLSLPDVRFE